MTEPVVRAAGLAERHGDLEAVRKTASGSPSAAISGRAIRREREFAFLC